MGEACCDNNAFCVFGVFFAFVAVLSIVYSVHCKTKFQLGGVRLCSDHLEVLKTTPLTAEYSQKI